MPVASRLILLVLLAALPAIAVAQVSTVSSAAPRLLWRVPELANRFWLLDRASKWDGRADAGRYAEPLKLSAEDRKLLASYAEMRQRLSQEPPHDDDMRHPLADKLVSPRPELRERFALAFFRSDTLAAASQQLGLSPADHKLLTHLFRHFGPRLDRIMRGAAGLETTKQALESLAGELHLPEFLAKQARFVGLADAPTQLTVNVVWAPPGDRQSTCMAEQMIISVAPGGDVGRGALVSTLGVVVHELGHTLVSLLPDAERMRLSDLLHRQHGLIQRRHANYIDEAVQTAIGNALFVRQAQSGKLDDPQLYLWEPENEWPDAIDTMARALEPLVRSHLDEPGAYGRVILPAALEIQRQTLGDRPRFHSRVALVWAQDKVAAQYFRTLFWAISRQMWTGETAPFVRAMEAAPQTARWVLARPDVQEPAVAQLAAVKAAKAAVEKGAGVACAVAVRAGADGDVEVAVLASDALRMRALLLAVWGAEGLPTAERPLCLTL